MFLSLFNLHAQQFISISNGNKLYEININDENSNVVKFNLNGFYSLSKGNSSSQSIIRVPELTGMDRLNFPDLPKVSFSLIVPVSGISSLKVIDEVYIDYPGYDIADFDKVGCRDFFNDRAETIYNKGIENKFLPTERASFQPLYHLDVICGQTIWLYPFAYNRSTKTLRVYSSITLHVNYQSVEKHLNVKNLNLSQEKNNIYSKQFLNYPAFQPSVTGNNQLLILANSSWIPLLEPLAAWKNQSGIETIIADISSISSDATAIKNYIYSYYSQHPLTHVLLAGDQNVIATPLSVATGGPSDPSYGYLDGNDSYPEVFVGRFPAESDSDLITMVQRVIEYEKNPDTTSNWFSSAIGVASNLGPGDDNEMDWEHLSNIRTELLNYTYDTVAEFYDGSHPLTTDLPGNPSASDVVSAFQSGISLMNYTGHGNNNSFTTSGFSTIEINQLTNFGKLPFIWSAGCTNGNFTSAGLCMGEAFLRARSNGKPTGAIAAFMSAVNQFWNPPMDAQDAMNAILTENDTIYSSRTFGGIVFSGCMQMNDHYGSAGALMTDTWHCFGDPSLAVRTAFPVVPVVSHASLITIGDTVFNISCSTNGANVTLYQSGKVIGKSIVANGSAVMPFLPVMDFDSVLITVSGFNLYPYIIKVPVLPFPGSYVIYKSVFNDDVQGNGDGIVDYGETISCDLTLYNAGLVDASGLHVSVFSPDTNIAVQNISSTIFNLDANDSLQLNLAFQYVVSKSVVDQHQVPITILVTDSMNEAWSSSYQQIINAPFLLSSVLSINDSLSSNPNGVAEAGENADVLIRYINSGHSDADSCYAKLSSVNPAVTLSNDSVLFSLSAQSDTMIAFNAQIVPGTPVNTLIELASHIYKGSYFSDSLYIITAGYEMEDFESGDFSQFNWQSSGSEPWIISAVNPGAGAFSAQSGDIDDNEESVLRIFLNVTRKDSLAFKYKVDCEPVWDGLSVKVDNVTRFEASGFVEWSAKAFLLDTGIHKIDFIYSKDNAASTGLDAALIDDARFPPFSEIVSVEEISQVGHNVIYPNPANDYFFIKSNSRKDIKAVFIYDVNSRCVYRSSNEFKEMQSLKIPIVGLKEGIYFVVMESDSEVLTSKLIVKH